MTSIYPGLSYTHFYRLRHRDPLSDITRAVCDCGWESEWMRSEAGAQNEADLHAMTGGFQLWEVGGR